jgi:hypothetical protein
MAYSRSLPLRSWLAPRREAIDTLATAHAAMGEVDGPGRPREIGRPLAHAYVLRVVAEFQGYVRDLHDLAAERMVDLAEPTAQFRPLLIAAATEGRFIDRGNADVRSVGQDFRRIGMSGLNGRLQARNARWAPQNARGDRAVYQELIELRNALAHGNQDQLDRLRTRGVADTVTWARGSLPPLNRTARALDRAVWDHLREVFRRDPW